MKKTKTIVALAAAFAAVAALSACKPDSNPAPRSSSGGGSIDIYDTSHVDPQFLVTFDDIAVRTAIGREVHLTVRAYCQTEAGRHRTAAAYNAACRAKIVDRVMFHAKHEDGVSRYESFLAMGNRDIRPYNYFDEDMLKRALPRNQRLHQMNLYTVTDFRECATGERIPTMEPHRQPPEGGWPNAEQRRAAQIATPASGTVIDGQCRFP